MSFESKTIGHCLSSRSSIWVQCTYISCTYIALNSSLSELLSFDLAEWSRKCYVHENWCSYLFDEANWRARVHVHNNFRCQCQFTNSIQSIADSLIFTRRKIRSAPILTVHLIMFHRQRYIYFRRKKSHTVQYAMYTLVHLESVKR